MLRNLNFGLGEAIAYDSLPPDLQRYTATDGGNADVSSTDIRLRLEPTIHVSRNVEVVATFDVFDNYSLGSSAATNNGNIILDDGTVESQDAIHVKRAYASLRALNEQLEVTLGRVPNHFGLGMLFNSGDCLSCDYGHTADRLSFGLNMLDHLFVASYDWVASGPTLSNDYPGRLGFDAFPWDDVDQWRLKLSEWILRNLSKTTSPKASPSSITAAGSFIEPKLVAPLRVAPLITQMLTLLPKKWPPVQPHKNDETGAFTS